MQQEEPQYAGFWIRVVTTIIDSMLIMLFTVPVLYWIYGRAYFGHGQGEWANGPVDFILSWILPAAAVILFWIYRQATPGKMLFNLRILDARTGEPPAMKQNILRYLGYYISTIPFGLGLIWVGLDSRKQGWHDKIANTVVVRGKRRAAAPARSEES